MQAQEQVRAHITSSSLPWRVDPRRRLWACRANASPFSGLMMSQKTSATGPRRMKLLLRKGLAPYLVSPAALKT